jgi:tellurite resistance protein TerC
VNTTPASWWIGFHIAAGAMLLADLSGLRRDPCTSLRKSLKWAVAWLFLACVLGAFLYLRAGRNLAAQFAAGYLLEQTLSVDNLFLFAVIFHSFQVHAAQQHRVLTWGVLGAIAIRAGFLVGGLTLLTHFRWVSYVFGTIVLLTGMALLRKSASPEQQPAWLRWLLSRLPSSSAPVNDRFFANTTTGRRLTPLLVALIAIELTDIIFALDSIPAVLSISRDAFVVYTSNILAVLSLRSLFPAVTAGLRRFHGLHYGIAIILLFVGGKMLLAERVSISPLQSLAVIAVVLAVSIALSTVFPSRRDPSTLG